MNSRSTSGDATRSLAGLPTEDQQHPRVATPLPASYRPGDFLFGSDQAGLLLSPERAVQLPVADVVAQVPQLLRDHQIITGALPFDPARPGHFLLGSAPVQDAGLPSWGAGTGSMGSPPVVCSLVAESGPEHYLETVRHALVSIAGAELEKIVLARSFRAEIAGEFPIGRVLKRLAQQNQHAYVFAAPLPGGRVMVGASPELLLRKTGAQVVSTPLAGSLPRSFDPETDTRRMELLQGSAKDLQEHDIVVQMVAEALAPWCRKLTVPRKPEILLTNTMIHLATRIAGELRPLPQAAAGRMNGKTGANAAPEGATERFPNALQLAAAVHPTPAVCGWPTGPARVLISDLESVDRDFYTGAVGWMNRCGDGEWAVTIRCAEVSNSEPPGESGEILRLFAGAGIVPGSQPEAELAEVEAKLRTMLLALELSPGPLTET